MVEGAKEVGHIPEAFNMLHTFGLASVLGLALIYGFYAVYMAGESRGKGSGKFAAAMTGGTLLSTILLTLLATIFITFGRGFLASLSNGIASYHALTPGTFESMAGMQLILGYYTAIVRFILSNPIVLMLLWRRCSSGRSWFPSTSLWRPPG